MRIRLLIIVFFPLIAMGQLALQEQYPFLRTEANRIRYNGDSAGFYRFFSKLDTLIFQGKGQVNILHMGGSHVQAGILSDAMREDMLSLSPGLRGDRGFFFPFRLAGTNNPRNYVVSYTGEWDGQRSSVPSHQSRWGASGITALTLDSNATFSIRAINRDTGTYRFDRFRLFYLVDDTSFVPEFEPTGLVDTVISHPDTNYVEFRLKQFTGEINIRLRKTSPIQKRFLLQGVQHVSNDPGLVYHAIGVNGASVKSYLGCVDFTPQLAKIHPDLVIFGIGINDAYKPEDVFTKEEFVSRYDTLVTEIRKVNPNVVFLFMTNNDSYYKRRYPNPNIFKVVEGMEELAGKYNGAWWDLFTVMGGFNSIKLWDSEGLASRDRIHFTRRGYELQAELFFFAFRRSYAQYCKWQR
ncbi:MAG: GDSL-type esterase/lipase family protein [Bacteroidota bacterium]|nr:GDSL-type esterase/lipase family protein [Bacteroidota bacterium]MDX5505069.1 GDSL-type esterase/lipase family protein [Bacteroidota bacterium]